MIALEHGERKSRILVVDNTQDVAEAVKEELQSGTCEVILAQGSDGRKLIADAKIKAIQQRCNVAIVDQRVKDEGNHEDTSGLELIPFFNDLSVPVIIYTRYNMDGTERRPARQDVFDIVRKRYGSLKELHETVNAALREKWPQLRILPEDHDALFASLLSEHDMDYHEEVYEIRNLLMRVFSGDESVTLHSIGGEWRTPVENGDTARRNSTVLRAARPDRNACVVKLASRERTEKELNNYREFIEDRLSGNQYLKLEKAETLWQLGISQYHTFAGTEPQTFSQYYRSKDSMTISGLLQGFFLTVWKPHYKTLDSFAGDLPINGGLAETSLFEDYDRQWRYLWKKKGVLKQSVEKYQNEPAPIGVIDLLTSFSNPFLWLKKHGNRYLPNLRRCIVHGDLHGDNLLVDTDNNIWPIDFERTGYGHVATDFAELEHDIVTRLADFKNLGQFYRLIIALTRPCRSDHCEDEWHATTEILTDPEMGKTFAVVRELRSNAFDLGVLDDGYDAYYLGVFFNTIFVLRGMIEEGRQTEERYARVYLLSVILCERLRNWNSQGQDWPPPDFNWPSSIVDSIPSQVQPTQLRKTKILFVTANPSDTERLLIDKEFRITQEILSHSDLRSSFELIFVPAARYSDLRKAMNEHSPDVIHFSGHGNHSGEICFIDGGTDESHPIRPETLADLVRLAGEKVCLVIMNGCYTQRQAEAIGDVVDFTIGMPYTVDDDTAIEFSRTFYESVGLGKRSIRKSFDLAKNALDSLDLPEKDMPVLLAKGKLDPSQAYLLEPVAND